MNTTPPILAIIGRPNVGKSTLFNRLCKTKALVSDTPGVTCDRHYSPMRWKNHEAIVIDTAGISMLDDHPLQDQLSAQAKVALEEAQRILWVVDGKIGLTSDDFELAKQLRKNKKPLFIIVNKAENFNQVVAEEELYRLGFPKVYLASALHNQGIQPLLEAVFSDWEASILSSEVEDKVEETSIKIAVVGRPNVGKSTLINSWLGEERMIVADLPGTTKDSISTSFTTKKNDFTLIDTAGLRRKTKLTKDSVEYLSVGSTLQNIHACHVVILLLSAKQSIAEQDLKILRYIEEAGRGLVIGVNQWDALSNEERKAYQAHIDDKLHFVNYAKIITVSALYQTKIYDLLSAAKQAYQAASIKATTKQLTELILKAQETHQPPLVNHRRIKLRYAHMVGNHPPHIMIHGKQCDALPQHYKKFLMNYIKKALQLTGTPLRLSFRTDDNPFSA